MSRLKLTAVTAALLGATALVASCNGSLLTAGIQGSGLTTAVDGPITGFGSVFVDGVEYSTAGAQIVIDGQPGSESQLSTGQIVTISGTVDSSGTQGSATSLTFTGDAVGPVGQIDTTAGTFAVLGQTVLVSGDTLFDPGIQPADLTGLHAGSLVEVSGYRDATGRIAALRIDAKPAGSTLQVKGAVSSLDTAAARFVIGSLTVDYGAAPPAGQLANGSIVVVQGSSIGSDGALQATHVEVLPAPGGAANQRADLQGLITSFTSSSAFVLQTQRVTTTASTVFVLHGATLAANLYVDVTGTFDGSGTLVAQKVTARPQSTSLTNGTVDAVDPSAGTLSVLGVNVATSADTVFEDHSSQHVRRFGLANIGTGDAILAQGAQDGTGGLDAALIIRESNANNPTLQGIAGNVSAPTFTLLGVTVVTDSRTVFAGPGGAGQGGAAFFSQASGQIVRATGTYANGTFTATRVQIVP